MFRNQKNWKQRIKYKKKWSWHKIWSRNKKKGRRKIEQSSRIKIIIEWGKKRNLAWSSKIRLILRSRNKHEAR